MTYQPHQSEDLALKVAGLDELVQLRRSVERMRACSDKHDALRHLADVELYIAGVQRMLNTPMTENFFEATRYEAAHQQERWGTENDAGKGPLDWLWLLGYLSNKAVAAFLKGDSEKGKHHIISSAAMLLNWHRYATGEITAMRPGIADPVARCPLCNYQHGHTIGCPHNPVDIALSAGRNKQD